MGKIRWPYFAFYVGMGVVALFAIFRFLQPDAGQDEYRFVHIVFVMLGIIVVFMRIEAAARKQNINK